MDKTQTSDIANASVVRGANPQDEMMALGRYKAQCFDASGALKWEEDFDNLVTTEGKNYLLDTVLIAGSAGTGALGNVNMFFRLGLITSGTPVVGDTYATHAGFAELGSGVVATRGSPQFSASSAGVKNTSAAVAFSVVGTGTITGAFIAVLNAATVGNLGVVADTATANAKLYSAGLFASSKSVSNGDTLNVTYSTTLT